MTDRCPECGSRPPAPRRIVMYEYECLDCGFRWQQSVYRDPEFECCGGCGGSSLHYHGSEQRELAPLTIVHRNVRKRLKGREE